MTNRSFSLSQGLYDYLLSVSLRDHEVLRDLRAETASNPMARMQIAPEQGQLMALLVRVGGFRRCIEVGVFTGYSSLSVAQALPDDGYLLACDIRQDWTDIARRYWQRAGVDHKIDLQIAPALETLTQRLDAGEAETYDFAFIDADKRGYIDYYEACLQLLRPGGLIAVDNTLWSGRVIDPQDQENGTKAIRAFNLHVAADKRIELSLVPIADGLTLCRKR
ncbi:O-methyltransferase family protein [Oceanococcus atlanticus]|uniref:O-methyltransferase family protein n=1 Tax=Oceanococcus atlanticus TaxID=1317117 RepID=A0A1Y1SEV2_9GAMM|nr:class I SAM-dependent methyltransferase [Oceanococcus atlanticus]ORE87530.1 O-methyltransferase family protein [Oceanococcus atlanticus]RZO87266.1 MAG: SAM-dependent methyltransferase [Oceanococcus sp.]